MVGRFLAYKAMNSVWRSATRGGRSGSSATPTESAKMVLGILCFAGIFMGGMTSCLAGNAGMFWFGLVLCWVVGPAVMFGVALMPDDWIDPTKAPSKRTGGDTQELPTRSSAPAPSKRRGGDTQELPTRSSAPAPSKRREGDYGKRVVTRKSSRPISESESRQQLDAGCWLYKGPCVHQRGCQAFFSNPGACYWNIATPGFAPQPYRTVSEALERYQETERAREPKQSRALNTNLYHRQVTGLSPTSAAQQSSTNLPIPAPPQPASTPSTAPELQTEGSVSEKQATPESRPYVVYFIRECRADGHCKVGVSYSVQSRLRALQTGNPNELEVAHVLGVSGRQEAERIEEAVLNAVRGAGANLQGEWFENAIVPWAWEIAQREQRING